VEASAFPPCIGSEADLAVLRGLFDRARFIEHEVCSRLKVRFAHEVDSRAARIRLAEFDDSDALGILIQLFVLGRAVPASTFDSACSVEERQALLETRLLRVADRDAVEHAECPVRLVTLTANQRSLILACDRELGIDERPIPLPADVVFPPHSMLTRQFLSVLPMPHEGSVLDLCTGAGVAALLSGGNAQRVVAVDIAARSARFSGFNAWLNAMPQVQTIEGDLYRPLGDERFRWVLAHPPYVPTFRPTAIFRDGGELGDAIVRQIVEGLADHLEVGGTLYMVCLGMDTGEGLFEERARRWIGPHGDAFDIIFATAKLRSVEAFSETLAEGAIHADPGEQERRLALFRAHDVTGVVHGALVARRLPEGSKGETHRVKVDSSTTAASFDWLFAWLAAARTPDFLERLLASRPRLLDGTRLDVGNIVENGEVVPRTFRLGNRGRPFPSTIETDPWVVRLVMALDGKVSLAEALARAREHGHLPEAFRKSDADRVFRYLIERGILGLDIPIQETTPGSAGV
jgi:methylase of polypeptide subunit release factors